MLQGGIAWTLEAFGAPATPVGEAAGKVGFEPALRGTIVLTAAQSLRQVLLLHPCLRRTMRVLVAPAVPEVLHEARRRVADMQRHGVCRTLAYVVERLVVRHIGGIRLRRERQVQRCLCEGQLPFG